MAPNMQFYSAFTLPDLNTPTPPTRPDDATANPYVAARGMKRGADGDGGMDGKRGKYENGTSECFSKPISRFWRMLIYEQMGDRIKCRLPATFARSATFLA